MTARSIVVIGGGGHARVVVDNLIASGERIHGFIDPAPSPGALGDTPYLGGDEILPTLARDLFSVFVALGDNALRQRLGGRARALGFRFANAIHPSAAIAPSVAIGVGIAVMPHAAVNAGTTIEEGAVINTGATVDHDCRIGAYAHVAPGSHLAGYVDVAEGVLVGVGSAVGRGRPLALGSWAVIGTGSVVVVDIEASAVMAGNPARPLRRRTV